MNPSLNHRFQTHFLTVFLALFLSITSFADTKLRLMTGNITSGNQQSYDPGHGTRIFQAFNPDVAMIQEFNYGNNSDKAIREFVDKTFGKEFQYYRESLRVEGAIPNGIVSRFPIKESGSVIDPTMPNRDLAWVRIDLPGGTDLWVFSVHFSHGSSSNRNVAAREVIKFIEAKVPKGDYVALGGDLNTTNRAEGCIRILGAQLTDAHVPKGQDGREGTNASRRKPYDLLLPNQNLEKHHVAVEIANAGSFPDGLVFDSRTFKPLSAVKPVQAGDSGSSNMQHMAVIKDFLIPD